MKIKISSLFLAISMICSIPQITFAKEPLTAEQIKLSQDQIKYAAYIPKGFVLFEAVEGDLNKDKTVDLVLLVKSTDPKQVIQHEYRGELDRNRRGVIVLLNQNGQYKELMRNLDCFSSENEEGGVYFAPELWLTVEKGLLDIHYGHGRYGYWRYLFRLENNDLRLIGYDDSSNHGPYVKSETSINFLTQRKVVRTNINEDPEGDPRFKESWSTIKKSPIYLSKITDFDELDVSTN